MFKYIQLPQVIPIIIFFCFFVLFQTKLDSKKVNIAVIGGGSWGTALVKILSDNISEKNTRINKISWWVRKEETVEYIRKYKHNPAYISSVEIHPELVHTKHNINEVIKDSDVLIFAIPSAFLFEAFKSTTAEMLKGKVIVSAIKGIVVQTRQLIADFFMTNFKIPVEEILVITGPCHAEEIAQEKLSYLTVAGKSPVHCKLVSDVITVRYLKTVISRDIFGTEYAAVLKNVYAIASGICHGLGYGDNFQAVLISNAAREIENFLNVAHPMERNISLSAYLGDLMVTAYSQFSRNRTFGNMVGKGYSVQSAQLEMNMIAEGYYATESMYEINRLVGVEMPILEAVHKILYEHKDPKEQIRILSDKLS